MNSALKKEFNPNLRSVFNNAKPASLKEQPPELGD
jgi:hypothetical protein